MDENYHFGGPAAISLRKMTAENLEWVLFVHVSREKHKAFLAQHKLPFPLLSDEDAVMTRWFGVYDEDAKEAKRVTFLIGKDGLIRRVWENVHVRVPRKESRKDPQAACF